MIEHYLVLWGLSPDGDAIRTLNAELQPVMRGVEPAMLKFSHDANGRLGGALMEWWDGEGAARVLARDDNAILLERATGPASLSDMARSGRDEDACRILCAAAARLHVPRHKPLPDLISLDHWFRELEPMAKSQGGILARCAETAKALLADQCEISVLHGDLHHGNVLDFGARGWLALDPKSLIGERTFDFANIFTNPDLADPTQPVATEPGCFVRRLNVVVEAGNLDRQRLLLWILAWTGLSASWFLREDDPLASIDLQIAELAIAELDR